MKYYSQYRSHDLCGLQESLSGLSKSNRWVKLADHFPWGRIKKEYNKRPRNSHNGAGNKPGRYVRLTLLYTYSLGWFYKLALLDFELIFEVKIQESEGVQRATRLNELTFWTKKKPKDNKTYFINI